jgi:hypothetical protein
MQECSAYWDSCAKREEFFALLNWGLLALAVAVVVGLVLWIQFGAKLGTEKETSFPPEGGRVVTYTSRRTGEIRKTRQYDSQDRLMR